MTNPIPDRSGFEGRLTTLLRERADAIEVHPDLEAVSVASITAERRPNRAGPRAWWLATAAALLVVAAFGLSRLAAEPNATTPDIADAAGPSEIGGETLIVWMKPDATLVEIEVVADGLAALPAVIEVSYLDAEGTWQQFVDHFADQPEVIDLVEADELPTSFRVVTSEPGDVGDLVTGLPGVDGVENAD